MSVYTMPTFVTGHHENFDMCGYYQRMLREAEQNEPVELFNIAGKTVVVSEATGYFGRTITEALDGLGANVVAMAHSERVLELIETRGLKNTTPVIVDLYDCEARPRRCAGSPTPANAWTG